MKIKDDKPSPSQKETQSFINEKLSMEEVDLGRYMEEAQPYLAKAIYDPACLNPQALREVGCIIINRAYEDPGYHTVAAKLCKHIAMREYANQQEVSIPNFIFRKSVIEHCIALFKDYKRMRNACLDYWLNFAKFLSNVYLCLCFKERHLADLANLLFKILEILIAPPCVDNPEEVELFISIVTSCGKHLSTNDQSHMNDLMFEIRDIFLEPFSNLTPDTKGKMLPLIELHACNWGLPREE